MHAGLWVPPSNLLTVPLVWASSMCLFIGSPGDSCCLAGRPNLENYCCIVMTGMSQSLKRWEIMLQAVVNHNLRSYQQISEKKSRLVALLTSNPSF